MSSYPHYPFPARILLDLTLAALTGGQRSFRAHACQMMAMLEQEPSIEGNDCIPQSGPGVITTNHYFRSGFWSPWFPVAVSAAVPCEIYWTMTDAFTMPGHFLHPVWRTISHWGLTRIAQVYAFNSMPPMPPTPDESRQRSAAVQRMVRYARENPGALIGLSPEGGDQPGGVLGYPPEGFGRLALLFSKMRLPFYPVGVFEEDGRLHVRFGTPYRLADDEFADRYSSDLFARKRVMQAIAACLPERLRGEFGVQI